MVARLQSIISKEIIEQLSQKEGVKNPNYLVACVGGGSNAAGTIYHYLNTNETKIILAEAAGKGVDSGESAATIHLGKKGIIHGSKTLVMQNEDGQILEPYSISAGLDYPGIGPLYAHLSKINRANFIAITDEQAINAALDLTRNEGIIPAIESAHAIAALSSLKLTNTDIVVVTVSGRGDKDMDTYIKYIS